MTKADDLRRRFSIDPDAPAAAESNGPVLVPDPPAADSTPTRRAGAATRRKPRKPATIVYMGPAIRRQLRAKAKQEGLTNTDVVLDAIDHLHTTGRLDAPQTRPVRAATSLFRGTSTHPPVEESDGRTQVAINPRPDDLATIDHLWHEHGYNNRSAFIERALTLYLDADDANK